MGKPRLCRAHDALLVVAIGSHDTHITPHRHRTPLTWANLYDDPDYLKITFTDHVLDIFPLLTEASFQSTPKSIQTLRG